MSMPFSPRYIVVVNLILLAGIAYASSSIVGTAIAARLMPPPAVHISAPPPPLEAEPKRADRYYALIHKRDIFNSVRPEPERPPEAAPPTPLKVKLWGIAMHGNGPSSCVIEDLQTRKQGLYHEGDEIQGATVTRVEWERVVLTRKGKEEILELSRDAKLPAPAAFGRAVAPRAALDEHIQLLGDGEYAIDRSEVDNALENMSQLFTQIRAVPHFEGGQSTGFRLFAIRQNSLFDKIGLRNGDIIQRINDVEVTDPARALALFQELRNERGLTVDIMRNREPKTLSYQIR